MKKQLAGGNTSFDNVLPEYGRKKLLMYADTFRDLANTFSEMQKQEENLPPMGERVSAYGAEEEISEGAVYGMETGDGTPGYGAVSGEGMADKDKLPALDRQEYLWKRRLVENRDLMADHLMEMAQIMTRIAEESYRFIHMSERKVKQLSHALKEENI